MLPRSSRPHRAMRSRVRFRFPVLAAALIPFVLSCAAPAELARRSEAALSKGHDRQAWDWAERAMRADPDLPRARAAMTAAAEHAAADWQSRVRNLAAADTIAAARLSLELGLMRAKLARWNIAMPLDSTFLDEQGVIRHAAATRLYDAGVALQREGRPREAYRQFTAAGEIVPGFRDVAERARRSFELGVTRVAVLPFDDDTGVPGLADELSSYLHDRIAAELPQRKYPFVRFVPKDAVMSHVYAEGRMTREGALRIARAVGARRIVWGRIHGLRTDTRTDTWRDRVFRRVAERDTSRRTRYRYEEALVTTVSRERRVTVEWLLQVLEPDNEESLAEQEGSEQVTARSVWTRFTPQGDCDDYVLLPPDWKDGRASEWKSAHDDWKQRFGDRSVGEFLEAAVQARERSHYRRADREAFLGSSRPFVCDDLPPASDLAFLALRAIDSPAVDAIRALEREPAP